MKLWMIPGWTRNDKISVHCDWGACHKRRCLRVVCQLLFLLHLFFVAAVVVVAAALIIISALWVSCAEGGDTHLCSWRSGALAWGFCSTAKGKTTSCFVVERERQRGEQKPRLNSVFMPGGYLLPSVPDTISWGAINKKNANSNWTHVFHDGKWLWPGENENCRAIC